MSRAKTVALLEQVVNYLLVRSGCFELPTDLEKVATYLGVTEIEVKGMAAEGFVEGLESGSYRIALKVGRSKERTRFSLAHELGHIVAHKLSSVDNGPLARQYRRCSAVSDGCDVEAVADLLAGILLVPPSAISTLLPRRFSMRGIESLAKETQASIPTAMLRAIWYATQPLFAFHLRRYSSRPEAARCMWVSSSRSLLHVPNERVKSLVDGNLISKIYGAVDQNASVLLVNDDAIQKVEFVEKSYFERETIYGIAYVTDAYADDQLFVHD